MKPGFHSITPDNYHADQHSDKGASLNSGTIKTMLTKSPRHAWESHPRLNPNYVRSDERKFDLGKIAHDLLLRDGAFLEVVEADSYRTKVAKEARAAALDAGRIPASGRGGRITKEDVIAFLESGPTSESVSAGASAATAPTASGASETGAQPLEERVKMSRMRRTIATRLKEAQDTAAILTTFNEVDMSAVMALRKKHRDAFESLRSPRRRRPGDIRIRWRRPSSRCDTAARPGAIRSRPTTIPSSPARTERPRRSPRRC